MKRFFLFLTLFSSFALADEITGLNLRTTAGSQAVNPTAVAGAVLSLDANKRPTFGGGIGIDSTGVLTFNSNAYFGSPSAATLRLGGSASATPVAQTLTVQPASGANIAGADFTIAGSQSTGSAAGGNIVFKTSLPGVAGTGTNSAQALMTLSYDATNYTRVTLGPSYASLRTHPSTSYNVIVGHNGFYNGGVFMGEDAYLGWNNGIGTGACDFIVSRDSAATLQLGTDHATTPTAQTIKAHDVTTGTGASMTIAGGKGSTSGGAVIIATSETNGTPTTALTIDSTRIATFSGSIYAQGGSGTAEAGTASVNCAYAVYAGGGFQVGNGRGVHFSNGTNYARFIKFGAGSPEGVITGDVGSLWMRTDGGAGTTLYVKESGTGNTGWVAK